MSKKQFRRVEFLTLISLLFSERGYTFDYFNREIDFWHDRQPHKADALTKGSPDALGPSEVAQNGADKKGLSSFPWDKYLNPQNPEFFKEGDYTPPEPFMEIVRNPTDSNLKMWFAYIEKKNDLQSRLQEKVKEYLSRQSTNMPDEARAIITERARPITVVEPESTRYRFRMYFDSSCPHCKRMFGTLTELQARGFIVEAKQVDHGSLQGLALPFPTEHATEREIKEKGIQSVPLLLVGDLKRKTIYRLSGYQTPSSVFQAIHAGEGN